VEEQRTGIQKEKQQVDPMDPELQLKWRKARCCEQEIYYFRVISALVDRNLNFKSISN
jgi:hypothetical protein